LYEDFEVFVELVYGKAGEGEVSAGVPLVGELEGKKRRQFDRWGEVGLLVSQVGVRY
jgi:hypothetical protein